MAGFLTLSDGRRVDVRDGMTIGRGKQCDVPLSDAKASRRHARLIVESGVVEVEDLDSSNGTFINGKQVERRMLRPGDVVQIGKTRLTYGLQDAPSAVAPAAPVDGVDLFGDSAESPPQSPPKPQSPKPQSPEPQPAAPTPETLAEQKPAPSEPAPRRDDVEVVEFVDEVVEVRKAARPPAGPGARAVAPAPVVEQRQRILQYSPHQHATHGALADDLRQMGTGRRALVVVVVIAIAVGLGYFAMVLARG